MTNIAVNFGSDARRKLVELGLQVYHFQGKRNIHQNTQLEAPLTVNAEILEGAPVKIGAFSSIQTGKLGNVTIGRYVSIANNICVGSHEHPIHWLSTSSIPYFPTRYDWDEYHRGLTNAEEGTRPKAIPFPGSCSTTHIGNDVWLGEGVFIRAGVKIGHGAVIGARSVVVSDIPPYAIAVGNPARVKRLRFDEATVERLLRLEWWRFALFDLMDVPFDDVDRAIILIEERINSQAIREYKGPTYDAGAFRMVFET